MTIDFGSSKNIGIGSISSILGERLSFEVIEGGMLELSAGELVQLAAQVVIAEALQDLVFVLREYTGVDEVTY